MIAFGAYAGRGIYVVPPGGAGLRRLTSLGGGDSTLSWSADGRTLLFDARGSVYRIGVDGHGLRALGPGFSPAWSPDGTRIAFIRDDGYYLMRADGSGVHKLAASGYAEFGSVAWSPDGRRIAFVACTAPYLSQPCEHQYGFDVYTVGSNGASKQRVTRRSGMPQCLAWSRSGILAFAAQGGAVAVVQRDGRVRTFRPGGCPSWTPGGRRLAVATSSGIGLINADGSGRRLLPVRPDVNEAFLEPTWSPDGRSLAIVGVGHDGRHRLYVIGSDGKRLQRIA